MAYPYGYLDGSLVPLPIYAPQRAPYSTDDPDNAPFEEWPVTITPPLTADCTSLASGNSAYRYTSDIAYITPPTYSQWYQGQSLSLLPLSNPPPPPDQWQNSTPPSGLHMAPEMEPTHFYPLGAPDSATSSSLLPPRTKVRAPIVYEEYGAQHDWEESQDSSPYKPHKRRRPVTPISPCTHDFQRSSRPKLSRTITSRPKRAQNPSSNPSSSAGSPVASGVSHPSAHASRIGNRSSSHSADPQAPEERQFPCEQGCPARFARKRDRDRHERSVHTGQTPYSCLGCKAGFVRSDARGRHWKSEPECHKKHVLAGRLEERPSPEDN